VFGHRRHGRNERYRRCFDRWSIDGRHFHRRHRNGWSFHGRSFDGRHFDRWSTGRRSKLRR
jgi:hypothetical protein